MTSVYVGREGQWSYILHRLTGVGVLLFLFVHIFETFLLTYSAQDPAAVAAGTSLYDQALEVYKTPYFRVAEVALVGAVVYHSFHGLRITIQDMWPNSWKYQKLAVRTQWAAFLIIMAIAAFFMLRPLFMPHGGA
ncbi:MAG TPA: succinate dehydrogenase, cytochrome b556 subunit [Candidatus Thermoplasmatota archaeon]|nr:succinate dehydrogenase, cytochrome b556 subunit [Candidatus Thermoplasmatota archaeon]